MEKGSSFYSRFETFKQRTHATLAGKDRVINEQGVASLTIDARHPQAIIYEDGEITIQLGDKAEITLEDEAFFNGIITSDEDDSDRDSLIIHYPFTGNPSDGPLTVIKLKARDGLNILKRKSRDLGLKWDIVASFFKEQHNQIKDTPATVKLSGLGVLIKIIDKAKEFTFSSQQKRDSFDFGSYTCRDKLSIKNLPTIGQVNMVATNPLEIWPVEAGLLYRRGGKILNPVRLVASIVGGEFCEGLEVDDPRDRKIFAYYLDYDGESREAKTILTMSLADAAQLLIRCCTEKLNIHKDLVSTVLAGYSNTLQELSNEDIRKHHQFDIVNSLRKYLVDGQI